LVQVLSAELILDVVLVRQLFNFVSSEQGSSSSPTALDISVHSARMRVLEQILLNKGSTGPSSVAGGSEDSRAVDVILHGSLTHLHIQSIPQAQPATVSVQGTFDELFIGLLTLPPSMGVILASPQPEFCLSMYTLQASRARSHIEISAGNFTVQMGPSDPEYIASLLLAAKNRAGTLSNIYQEWRSRITTSLLALVRHILWLTRDNALVDPLSIIQPSFLVQRGLPHAVRTNGPLKFLFHLRQCLSQCDLTSDSEQWSGDQEVRQLIKSRLANLMVDLDTLDEVDANPWDLLFPPENPSPAKSSSVPPSVTCGVGTMHLTILSISSKSHSYITSSMLRLQYQSNPLVQFRSTSHISHPTQTTQQIAILGVADVSLIASPHLVDFAQGAIRVNTYWQNDSSSDGNPTRATRPPSQTILVAHVGSMNICAGAENLTFEVTGSSLDFSSSSLVRPDIGTESASGVFVFSDIHVRARSKGADTGISEQDILASLALANGRIDAAQRHDIASKTLRVIFGLDEILVSVPRSAIRLYHFVEEWRADFLPGVEATAETLVSELKRNSMSTASLARSTERLSTILHVNGRIARLGVTLQVMRGTWLSWTVEDTTGFVSSSPTSPSNRTYDFGLQLGSQGFTVTYKSRNVENSTGSPRVKFILPALALTGHQKKGGIELLGALEFVNVMIKPTHMDTLLAVQQKFGQDFTDLLDLIQETRQKHSVVSDPNQATGPPGKFIAHVNVKGFRLGLEGPSSVFHLECQDVWGDIAKKDDNLEWKVQLRNLALSLAPCTGVASHEYGFDVNEKSAFVIIDITTSANDGVLKVSVPKIHAVMQPSSISELGDFIDYHQVWIFPRRGCHI
jgi:hypothetical protein